MGCLKLFDSLADPLLRVVTFIACLSSILLVSIFSSSSPSAFSTKLNTIVEVES